MGDTSSEYMGVAPFDAIPKALAAAGLNIGDIDRQLNPHGGAIALGHLFGMTGVRTMGTLLNGLRTTDGTWGLETMCVAGGVAMAVVVERLS